MRTAPGGLSRKGDPIMPQSTPPPLTLSFVVKLTAKPDTADEVAAFLGDAVQLAEDEAGTVVWYALRTDPTTFSIVDAFASEADRPAHLHGPTAAPLGGHSDPLLPSPPHIPPPH